MTSRREGAEEGELARELEKKSVFSLSKNRANYQSRMRQMVARAKDVNASPDDAVLAKRFHHRLAQRGMAREPR